MEKTTTKRFILRHSSLPENISKGWEFNLNEENEPEIFYQLTRVFRIKNGQAVVLMNKNSLKSSNTEYHLQVASLSKRAIHFQALSTQEIFEPFSQKLILALCLPNKPAKLDFILEKGTELGANGFKLISSDLSNFSHQLRNERLEKIILEASEQSERSQVPTLQTFLSLDSYLENVDFPVFSCLERGNGRQSILEVPFNHNLELLIGPEGGFSEREVALIIKKTTPINLGGHILKMDTAALMALAIASLKLQQS